MVCVDFEILHLFVSTGHNYFGHHEKPPGDHATVDAAEIQCIVGKGIAGDRYFEVLSGLQSGDQVITGPYNSIRGMAEGDLVKVDDKNK